MKRSPSKGGSKLLTPGGLAAWLASVRRQKKKVVFTNGCFDVLHVGHVRYLHRARSLGDLLVIGLNTDASVRRLKGPGRPVNSEKDRAEVLGSLASVDAVVLFDDPTPLALIRKVKPDWLVKGGDWKKKDIVGSDFVEGRGGKVRSLPFVKGFSTTAVLEAIQKL